MQSAPAEGPLPIQEKALGRLRLLQFLLLPAIEVRGFWWIGMEDASACRWGASELVTLGVVAGTLLVVEGLRLLGRRAGQALAIALFVLSLPAGLLLFAAPVMGLGKPEILPNADGFRDLLPESVGRLEVAFREIRLIFNRNQSVMQGSSRVVYIAGSPHRFWYQAFANLPQEGPTGFRRCATDLPSLWRRTGCPLPGPGRECFACDSGNWNHSRSYLILFAAQGQHAVLYGGTGPTFERAVKDSAILALAEARVRLRYAPATSPPDSDHEALFARLYGKEPVTRPLLPGEERWLKECLSWGDIPCLDAFVQSDPSGYIFEPILNKGVEYERVNAAIALSAVRHPRALDVLPKGIKEASLGRLIELAAALGRYGHAASAVVPRLLARADSLQSSPGPWGLIDPMLRIGSPEALDYVGRFAADRIRREDAETIEKAFAAMESPSPESLKRLRAWTKRQHELDAGESRPLLSALLKAAGPEAVRPYSKWVKEMTAHGRITNEWTHLAEALESK